MTEEQKTQLLGTIDTLKEIYESNRTPLALDLTATAGAYLMAVLQQNDFDIETYISTKFGEAAA